MSTIEVTTLEKCGRRKMQTNPEYHAGDCQSIDHQSVDSPSVDGVRGLSQPLGYMSSPTSLDELKARFARNLRIRRLELGLSQEKVSVLAHVHRTYISQVERQVCNPTLELMLSMANALDIDVSELLKK